MQREKATMPEVLDDLPEGAHREVDVPRPGAVAVASRCGARGEFVQVRNEFLKAVMQVAAPGLGHGGRIGDRVIAWAGRLRRLYARAL